MSTPYHYEQDDYDAYDGANDLPEMTGMEYPDCCGCGNQPEECVCGEDMYPPDNDHDDYHSDPDGW